MMDHDWVPINAIMWNAECSRCGCRKRDYALAKDSAIDRITSYPDPKQNRPIAYETDGTEDCDFELVRKCIQS